jgi:hypothetical protein
MLLSLTSAYATNMAAMLGTIQLEDAVMSIAADAAVACFEQCLCPVNKHVSDQAASEQSGLRCSIRACTFALIKSTEHEAVGRATCRLYPVLLSSSMQAAASALMHGMGQALLWPLSAFPLVIAN